MQGYVYNGTTYTDFSQIKALFPHVSFPASVTADVLKPFNVTLTTIADPTNVYVYYNNGLSYKTELSTYTVQTGEVIFTSTPTTAQLESAFSGYDAAMLSQAQNTAIDTLKQLLASTDYIALKYAEGLITADKYANVKVARTAWRTAIDTIRSATTLAAVQAVTYSTTIPSYT